MVHKPIHPPNTRQILSPLLSSLPSAAVSPTPPPSLLPYLSPILRQRLQFLSNLQSTQSENEPYLPLLTYTKDPKTLKRLSDTALHNEGLIPHPVSGEVEIDWDDPLGVQVSYTRVDEDTFVGDVRILEVGLWVRLVWCVGDVNGYNGSSENGGDGSGDGSGDGWRIGEVSVVSDVDDVICGRNREQSSEGKGWDSIGEAEGHWKGECVRDAVRKSSDALAVQESNSNFNTHGNNQDGIEAEEEEDDDDDDYWAQYDNEPSRTPAQNPSPAPAQRSGTRTMASYGNGSSNGNGYENGNREEEDAYYAQYSAVQPALDSHDPDEAHQIHQHEIETSLNGDSILDAYTNGYGHDNSNNHNLASGSGAEETNENEIQQPRPSLSPPRSSSSRSSTVEELERKVEESEMKNRSSRSSSDSQPPDSEVAVRQHIASSLKSLWRLGRSVGMEMGEFRRCVGVEMEFLEMLEGADEQ